MGEADFGTIGNTAGVNLNNHDLLNGRFFGGDVVNQRIVSGAPITAPVPEPVCLALAGLAAVLCLVKRHVARR